MLSAGSAQMLLKRHGLPRLTINGWLNLANASGQLHFNMFLNRKQMKGLLTEGNFVLIYHMMGTGPGTYGSGFFVFLQLARTEVFSFTKQRLMILFYIG